MDMTTIKRLGAGKLYTAVTLFIFILICLFIKFDVLDSNFFGASHPSPILGENNRIIQSLVCDGPISKLEISFGTYDKPLRGALILILADHEGREVWRSNYEGEKVLNNVFTEFEINKRLKRGRYYLHIRYLPQDADDRLSVWTNRRNRYIRGWWTLDGERRLGDVVFRIYYKIGFIPGMLLASQRNHFVSPVVFITLLLLLLISSAWLVFHLLFRLKD